MTSADDATNATNATNAPDETNVEGTPAVDSASLVPPAPDRELTPLEQAIADGQAGRGDMNDVIAQFVNAQIIVTTATEVTEDLNEMQPVLFDREGTPMLAAFTHVDRIPQGVVDVASYAVQLPAAELVQAIPAETGLVINPGNSEGFEMLPEGVAQLAADVRGMIEAMEQQEQAEVAPTTPAKISPSSIPNF